MRPLIAVLALTSLFALSWSIPTATRSYTLQLHEKRSSTPKAWKRSERVHPDAILPIRIGLTQSNLENIYEHLMDVADPDSPNYGKHR